MSHCSADPAQTFFTVHSLFLSRDIFLYGIKQRQHLHTAIMSEQASPRLYVGNLPYSAQRADISGLFASNNIEM
jgi:hypothetical protein